MMAGRTLFVTFMLLLLGTDFQLIRGQQHDEERPGVCPQLNFLSLETCSELCTADANCQPGRKCCKTFCNGMSCKVPDEKPGVCPEVKEAHGEPCPPDRDCMSDSTCKESLKCCLSSCGRYFCQSPQDTKDERNVPHTVATDPETLPNATNVTTMTTVTTVNDAKGNEENHDPVSK